ncbi:MAG TPA: response regulator transcription factor [Bacillota bacterium]|nr:response regulator transcription factor [Bacillota bacterium]HPE38042.1 response regulator transcription factor [Bacillota bacterium]
MKTRLIIIDDDRFIVSALTTILSADTAIEVVATGNDGSEALTLWRAHQPDVLLMDIRMPGTDGLQGAAEVITAFPEAKILFLTTFSDDEYIVKALRIGARGYLLKEKFESIAPAISAVRAGQSVFGEEIISRITFPVTSLYDDQPEKGGDVATVGSKSIPTDDPLYACLTPREVNILEAISAGLSNKEIAEQLFLSEGTVRNSITSMLDKLELKSRTQLAIYYLKRQ